jgi:hypothetical protein
LYGLGRIEPLLGGNEALATARAVLFHRTALAIDGNNKLAANELGVLLVQHGHLADAEQVLQIAATLGASSPSVEHNLAVVRRRLGKSSPSGIQPMDAAMLARQQPTHPDRQIVQTSSAPEMLAGLSMNVGPKVTATDNSSEQISPTATEPREPLTLRTAWKRLTGVTKVNRR